MASREFNVSNKTGSITLFLSNAPWPIIRVKLNCNMNEPIAFSESFSNAQEKNIDF